MSQVRWEHLLECRGAGIKFLEFLRRLQGVDFQSHAYIRGEGWVRLAMSSLAWDIENECRFFCPPRARKRFKGLFCSTL
jgi:hypothetical protein